MLFNKSLAGDANKTRGYRVVVYRPPRIDRVDVVNRQQGFRDDRHNANNQPGRLITEVKDLPGNGY
jgi:hypothetical protein